MKKERLSRIVELITENDIKTQDMLVEALNNDGYNVTQATVSRDIKKLGLVKSVKNGINKYVLKNENEVDEHHLILRNAILSVQTAKNIVVIKCRNGMANATCVFIDSLELGGVIGTLAGDDTIFIASADDESADNIKHMILTKIQ